MGNTSVTGNALTVYMMLRDAEVGKITTTVTSFSSGYTKLGASVPVQMGSAAGVTVGVNIPGTPGCTAEGPYVDDVNVGGENAINPSAIFFIDELRGG